MQGLFLSLLREKIRCSYFKEIKDVKQTIGIDRNSHTVNLLTTHLDKRNTETMMLGLVMSEPRQLGALFAMMGNKEKKVQ